MVSSGPRPDSYDDAIARARAASAALGRIVQDLATGGVDAVDRSDTPTRAQLVRRLNEDLNR